MSLTFETLSLTNFGPYRSSSIDLNPVGDAPITLIYGENTIGKTTLFRALRWCLYGTLEPQQEVTAANRSLADLLNRPAARDGENELGVQLRFRYRADPYVLTRTAKVEGGHVRVTTDLRIGPTVVIPGAIDAEIGRLLHPQISEFFLFDGELLKQFYDRLNTDRERDFIRSSIDSVLGIPALQRAERDIAQLADDAIQRQARALKDAAESDRARKNLLRLKSDQESLEKDRAEVQSALDQASIQLRDVKEKIADIGELQADAREQETLESLLEGGAQEEARLRDELRQVIAEGWFAPAAARVQATLLEVQTRNSAAQDQQRELFAAQARVTMLAKQIEGGMCATCHQQLPPADDHTHTDLLEAEATLESLKNDFGDGPNLVLERRLRTLVDSVTAVRYREKQNQLDTLLIAQFERGRRLASLKDRLRGNDAAAIRNLGDRQIELDDVIARYEAQLASFKPKMDVLLAAQNREARILSQVKGADPALAAEATFFGYSRSLLQRTIDRYQERTREDVELGSSEMFLSLVRDPQGYSGLRIGRDYRVDLLGKDSNPTSTSEGGKQLVALSLIGALKQAAVRGGPVVLDSPLARLDLDHRENVLQRWVPSLGNQAVLLVQSGELTPEDAKTIMGASIGAEYRLFRPNNDPEEVEIERLG